MLLDYTYHMTHRTTVLLDEPTRQAARDLARHYECTASEAIRRAVVRHRDTVLGSPRMQRKQRRKILERLFWLFNGSRPEEEIRRLKAEDAGF